GACEEGDQASAERDSAFEAERAEDPVAVRDPVPELPKLPLARGRQDQVVEGQLRARLDSARERLEAPVRLAPAALEEIVERQLRIVRFPLGRERPCGRDGVEDLTLGQLEAV